MAKIILAATPAASTLQYHLPEADRQAILAKSHWQATRLEIERQRASFAHRNKGCAFGQIPQQDNK